MLYDEEGAEPTKLRHPRAVGSLEFGSSACELRPQFPVFSLEPFDLLAEACEYGFQLGLGEARRDVLRAVPVEGFQVEQEGAFALPL